MRNSGTIGEDKAIFERPNYGIQQDLEPLIIWEKVENIGINKVLVDRGATLNIMPHSMLRKIVKFDINLRPHNMAISNYEGKVGMALGIIQVNVMVGTISRPTLFMLSKPKKIIARCRVRNRSMV